MTNLKIGDKAPDFCGKDQTGQDICLGDYKGYKLVLYFYPKDNTTGCTAQAISMRNSYDVFLENSYMVLGVSPDNEKSHQNFIAKHNLPFPLIADTDKVIANAYGVWAEKSMYGRTYMGIVRTTFVIDEHGVIENIIEKVTTKNHAEQLLN